MSSSPVRLPVSCLAVLTLLVLASECGQAQDSADYTVDPSLFQDEYVKVDARVTLSNANNSWAVSIIGRNLDNELTSNYGDDVPAQAGTVWRSVDAPRSIALQGTWRF